MVRLYVANKLLLQECKMRASQNWQFCLCVTFLRRIDPQFGVQWIEQYRNS